MSPLSKKIVRYKVELISDSEIYPGFIETVSEEEIYLLVPPTMPDVDSSPEGRSGWSSTLPWEKA